MSKKMSKEAYYDLIRGIRERLASDECRQCSCPKTNCQWHGDCHSCVRLHRMNGDHLPNCLQFILADKIRQMAAVAEMDVKKRPPRPPDYWDYVRERDEEKGES